MATTLVRFVLGGHLGAQFGAEWPLHLENPTVSEAIRAVNANTKGELRKALAKDGKSQYYRVCLGNKDNDLDKDELKNPTGRQDIYLLPVIQGSESGAGKIIAGIIIAVVAWYAAPYVAGFIGSGVTAGQVALVGYGLAASMMLGGIVQLLTPVPSFNNDSQGDSRRGTTFQGNSTQISQGGAVGLVYGRALVPPMPISISLTAVDQAIVNSIAPQGYEIRIGPGGIIEYVPIDPDSTDNLPAR